MAERRDKQTEHPSHNDGRDGDRQPVRGLDDAQPTPLLTNSTIRGAAPDWPRHGSCSGRRCTRADLTLRDLDDVTLDREIAEQEGLVASNPSMAKYMQLSLQLHQAERQRRNVALGPALLAQSTLTLRKSKEAPRGLPKRARPVWLNNGRHPSKLGTFQNIEGLYKYDLGDGPRSAEDKIR